ncbi:MAG TPA: hypothetical protein VEP47_16520 [Reyranella sp.]|jgi:hypothetical protein|nr:hypothetical protein [Reyranella sp.]
MTLSAQFQREADAARIGLADTLGQLRDGMAPSALSAEAIALVKDSGLSILKTLAEQARANPVPALLIGAGLTMLLTRTTGSDVMGAATSTLKSAAASGADVARGASSAAKQAAAGAVGAAKQAVAGAAVVAGDRVAGTMASARESVTGGVEAAKETLNAATDRLQSGVDQGKEALDARRRQAGEMADELSGQARTMAEDASQSIARLIEEQPILMAALGAALGAAVGAALPLSQAEKDLLGETAAKALGAGREALSGAANVVRQEVAGADIGAKIGDIADKVVHNVTKDIGNPVRT